MNENVSSEKYVPMIGEASTGNFKGTKHCEIRRLDQKIDSIREIRFWSGRTIVDILLAMIATASTTIALDYSSCR